MSKKENYSKGKLAEKIAVSFLLEKGYQILATNYRTPHSEIDILAKVQGKLVIVEVKSSWNSDISPQSQMNARKRKQLQKAAETLSFYRPDLSLPLGLEVILVSMPDQTIEHFQEEFFDL